MSAPTDDYGWADAMEMAVAIFDQGARRSGRTSRLIATVQPGDRILTTERRQADMLRAELKRAGKPTVEVIVCPPSGPQLHEFRHRKLEPGTRPRMSSPPWRQIDGRVPRDRCHGHLCG